MSELGRAVTEKLKGAVPDQVVEEVLREAQIIATAAIPTPVRLLVHEVNFSGTKQLRGAEKDGDGKDEVILEPLEFSWTLGPGLHVVGSHENLRGKSTVLEVIRWALRGRCRLQEDVRSWLKHVQVIFLVNEERIVVDFEVRDGEPVGAVHREGAEGTGRVELARFDTDEAFEQAMDSVMMTRLHLQRITAWQEDQAVEHAWVAYASALSISSNGLNTLLGDVAFSGMASRLLQMFVGAAWAASRAQAGTAVKATEAALARLDQQTKRQEEASIGKRQEAADRVRVAEAALDCIPDMSGRLEEFEAAEGRVGQLGAQISGLRLQLDGLRDVERGAQRELLEERARAHAELEDALGRRFFNALRPTACPRCAAPVTESRRAEEAQGHECSVCTNELDLEAFAHEALVASSAPALERESALRSAEFADGEAVEEGPADGEAALRRVLEEAASAADRIEGQLRALERARDDAASLARAGGELASLAGRQREAELELARAQGARDALEPTPTVAESSERGELESRRRVLKAAEQITAAWVQDAQRGTLTELSRKIATLARDFGIPQLTAVELGGAATMKVHKGGVVTSYSRCTAGEQLRLKVATAVALLDAGFSSGIGRHPGLLTVDSPGSEEATQDSLDTMLLALESAAGDSPDMQVIIATTRTELLEELIPQSRRRVASPGGYLW
ncbi:hypothetical protein [Pseudonocardia alni]|uniref:hypothetical protein n=1 Tax=Pseudonocardia alni TaxID=33907 RepID=UPI00280B3398|nr:hypothetical protein [Pseudonocardia alni]